MAPRLPSATMVLLLLLLPLLASTASAQLLAALAGRDGGQQGAPCLLTPAAIAALDLRDVAAACKAGTPQQALCQQCVCELVDAFAPALTASGVTAQAASQAGASRDAATAAITACLSSVLPAFQRAGVNLGVLLSLQQCPASPAPACLQGLQLGS